MENKEILYDIIKIDVIGTLQIKGNLVEFLAVYLNDKLEQYENPSVFIYRGCLIVNKNISKDEKIKEKLINYLHNLSKKFLFSYKLKQLEKNRLPKEITEDNKDLCLKSTIYQTSCFCLMRIKEEIEYLEFISSKNTVFKLKYLMNKLINEYEYIINYLDENIITGIENFNNKDVYLKECSKILDDIAFVLYTIYLNNSPVVSNNNKLKEYKNVLHNMIREFTHIKDCDKKNIYDIKDTDIEFFKIIYEINITFKYIIRLDHDKQINKDYLESSYNKIIYLIYKIYHFVDIDLLYNYEYKDKNYIKHKHKINKLKETNINYKR